MSAPKGKVKSRKWWSRIGLGLLCLVLVTGEVARRAVTGHGHLHKWAVDIYHRYKAARMESARAAYGLPERADTSLTLYDDALVNGWIDWSWAKHDINATEHVMQGSHAIVMTPEGYKGVYLHHPPIGTAGFGTLQFYMFGNGALKVGMVDAAGTFGAQVSTENYRKSAPGLPAGWSVVEIPLTELGISHLGDSITGFVFQATTSNTTNDLFLDAISLQPDPTLPLPPTSATVAVTIDLNADRHPISPYIYGLAFAPDDYLTDLRLANNRWGGNDKTRYNWVQGNADSAARDWNWANRIADADGNPPPGPSSSADAFLRRNRAAKVASVLTVPTMGWVARDADNSHASQAVPAEGGPPLNGTDGAISGYDPAVNRVRTSLPSAAHKPTPFQDPPDPNSTTIYQDEWVNHLVKTFGTTAKGGVEFYAMDNEPDLWDFTHTDVHPAQMGYDAMLANFLEYADAIKAVDPSAQILGPVLSGWTSLSYSSLDRGTDKFHTHADCTQHGGEAFTLWFLKQVRAHDERTHKRSLDVLDIHYYPQGQGLYGEGVDLDTQARRLRSTRSLWDPTYTDESWIAEPVELIPRLKRWIAAGYPGTKLGITEWNFGADKDMNGALTIADVLGIFGREDVYLANYWAWPMKNSPGYLAFRLYRNADGQGNGFGDVACRALSQDSNRVACYAATETRTGDLTLLLINKMRKATVSAPLTFQNGDLYQSNVRRWTLSAQHPGELVYDTGPPLQQTNRTLSLPPGSITLVRLSAAKK